MNSSRDTSVALSVVEPRTRGEATNMIVLTRLNGTRFAINDEQIERLEDGPETVVVLVNGNRYTARESLDEVIELIVEFRSNIVNAAVLARPTHRRDAVEHAVDGSIV